MLVPLAFSLPSAIEGELWRDFPAAAVIMAPLFGAAAGGLGLVPSLRWARKRQRGLPDGFVILAASCVLYLGFLAISALVTSAFGGDPLRSFFLGGAVTLPFALSTAVGALFLQVETRRALIAGWSVVVLVVAVACARLVLGE